jgi:ribonuclease P protein component
MMPLIPLLPLTQTKVYRCFREAPHVVHTADCTLVAHSQASLAAMGYQWHPGCGRFIFHKTRSSEMNRPLVENCEKDLILPSFYGITVSKRVGTAVTRNRIKRRLRHWFADHSAEFRQSGWVYVCIPRAACALVPWDRLCEQMLYCLRRIHGAGRTQKKKGAHDKR